MKEIEIRVPKIHADAVRLKQLQNFTTLVLEPDRARDGIVGFKHRVSQHHLQPAQ
ncbi:hypothetical protein D3C73_1647480 [compost metagenome]